MMSDHKNEKKYEIGETLKPAEPAKELILPDIYAENNWEPKLTLKDHISRDDEGPDGFNPYDTAVLHKK